MEKRAIFISLTLKNPAAWLEMGARLSHIISVAVMMGTMAARITHR